MARIHLKNLDAVGRKHQKLLAGYKGLLLVCTGTGCVSAGGFVIRDSLQAMLKKRRLDKKWLVVQTGCNGFCAMGPILVVQPEGIFYEKLNEKSLEKVVEEHLVGGKPVKASMHKDLATGNPIPKMAQIPFFAKQQLVALRNKGIVDPENIESAIAMGAYAGLRKALTTMKPGDVLGEVVRSGIRGRGGAGFVTGVKWGACIKAVGPSLEHPERRPPVLVCNADEGDPGAFMDRSIIETDPHAVLEGMCLGAYAIGASEGFIYIRKEYPLAIERLEKAIAQARERGLLGRKILGSDFAFDIKVHRGAGAFVCGESTALMASMEGRVGEPRAKYVHNVESGYMGRPTVLNNVETWANVPVIVEKGGAWFGSIGTGDVAKSPWNGSSGTKVFSLVGNIANTGLVEVPMGIRLKEIIFDIGGGIPGGREFKAVQTGGPSGGCLPQSMLDLPVDFDSLTKAGSMMGSGGMIVMDDRTCMVDVAKYFIDFLKDESCGKCTPCREGLIAVSEILGAITRGQATEALLGELEGLCDTMAVSSLCQLGATAPNPVLSTLKYFRDEYVAHIRNHKCPAGVCKSLIRYEITPNCNGCHVCSRNCPTNCIAGEKKTLHVIDANACIKCGICRDVCKFDAVRVG
ncbi:MAG: SLBB domain-containing protein [Deltaproteobacteria bacterium]|nr:SLBB domain-containing protein [Deltaproteobacteria bacterium]